MFHINKRQLETGQTEDAKPNWGVAQGEDRSKYVLRLQKENYQEPNKA